MNLYEILDSEGTVIAGPFSYTEAQRFLQKNSMDRGEFTIELYMPKRPVAVEAEETEAEFSALYELELEIQRSKAMEGFGIDPETRERAKADTKRLTARLYAAVSALPLETAEAYGNYRLSQR